MISSYGLTHKRVESHMPMGRKHIQAFLAASFVTAGSSGCLAGAASLPPPVAPHGYLHVAQTGGTAIACPPMPQPYAGPLQFGSKYAGSGPARDTVNATAEAAYLSATAGINAFEADAADLTDAYLRSGDAADLSCLADLFNRWSSAHALEGPAVDYSGKSIRKWALASAAGSYLRLAVSSSQPLQGFPVADGNVHAWLSRLADQVDRKSTRLNSSHSS